MRRNYTLWLAVPGCFHLSRTEKDRQVFLTAAIIKLGRRSRQSDGIHPGGHRERTGAFTAPCLVNTPP